MKSVRSGQRGIALVTVMLASVLLAAALAVMLNVSTAQLRRSVEDLRGLQAQAGTDAGAGWLRALLLEKNGNLQDAITAIYLAGGAETITLDSQTTVRVTVAVVQPGAAGSLDHADVNLQQSLQINEGPVQVVSTAVVTVGGAQVAQRTTTTLLRIFQNATPYSEIVGVVDDAGPDAIDSPGDAAGQAAGENKTDLLVHAFTQLPGGPPHQQDNFKDQTWADGNPGGGGVLP